MKKIILPLLAALMIMSQESAAQKSSDENEVQVKISREVDGEMIHFEKSYPSEEAMRSDEELQEFIGKENSFPFDPPPAPPHPQIWHPGANMTFHFDGDSLSKRIKVLTDSGHYAFSYHLDDMEEHMKDMKVIIDRQLQNVQDMDFHIAMPDMDSLQENIEVMVKKIADVDHKPPTPTPTRDISISPDVSAFGKRARLKDHERLELNDLGVKVSPLASIYLRMETPDSEADLTISVRDTNDRLLFHQLIPAFAGRYSQHIDLRKYDAGDYLLTLQHGDKKLLRSITIK
ncbi:hypothetical protein [Marinoscillum furvescens]|uniref:Secreted protein (Por secretion system target) n=1 Tax=Marinoscillum furvescens DSM 4134 TaxID=1122208 RepID=A0A3D9L4E0_MARFU|nr:hypothetical protein [Marinoscillum furvescens]RED98817.1 hypothetical protein C7460_1098 [Marinoscillum furvescens DSM 4134]